MNSLELVGIGLIALLLYSVVVWIRACRRGRLRYELKRSINMIRPLVHFVWTPYIIIGSVVVTPAIVEWVNKQALTASTETSQWIYQSIPFVWVITTMIIVSWIVWQSFKPWIKYSDEELAWQLEDKAKNKEKLSKLFGWVKIRRWL